MKRTPSLTALARNPVSRRVDASQDTDMADAHLGITRSSALPPVGSLPGHLPLLPEGDFALALSSSTNPWSYGAEPGVEAWRPPPNCQTHDGSNPGSLKKCSFCQRNLDHFDIFMYRGEKAFCSLECRHHQILMDERQAMFKLAGKRYSMVPFVGPTDMVRTHGSSCFRADGGNSNVRTFV